MRNNILQARARREKINHWLVAAGIAALYIIAILGLVSLTFASREYQSEIYRKLDTIHMLDVEIANREWKIEHMGGTE